MKKTFLVLTASSLLSGVLFTNCSSPAEKVAESQETVLEANEELDEAKEDYLIEIEDYRIASAEKIAANDKSIADFQARVAEQKKEEKAAYLEKIKALEQKNSDLKMRLETYQAEGKSKWDVFKTEFNHDMDELGKAFKDLGVKNTK